MYLCVGKETLKCYNHENSIQIRPLEDHAQRLVSEKVAAVDDLFGLPAQGLAQRETNDNDGPDRGPHVGDRADFGILSDTNDRRRQLLRRTGAILRRLKNNEILAKPR